MFENELFQLIQYTPATDKVAAEPLLYVPPLVNRYYMIDLVPRQSLVKWLVDEGRTVFVISWVNPGDELKDKDVGDYVLEGIVEAIGEVRKRTGTAPDLFAFCLGGTLVAIALAWLAAKGRADEVNSRDPDRQRWSTSPTCATGRPSFTKAISPRSRIISKPRDSSTAWSFSGCSRRCAPTTSSGRRS